MFCVRLSLLFAISVKTAIGIEFEERHGVFSAVREWKERAAEFGISLIPFGTGEVYPKYWTQILIVDFPQPSHYQLMLDRMDLKCVQYNYKDVREYDLPTHMKLLGPFLLHAVARRCEEFASVTQAVTRELIKSAFSYSDVQPENLTNKRVSSSPQIELIYKDPDEKGFGLWTLVNDTKQNVDALTDPFFVEYVKNFTALNAESLPNPQAQIQLVERMRDAGFDVDSYLSYDHESRSQPDSTTANPFTSPSTSTSFSTTAKFVSTSPRPNSQTRSVTESQTSYSTTESSSMPSSEAPSHSSSAPTMLANTTSSDNYSNSLDTGRVLNTEKGTTNASKGTTVSIPPLSVGRKRINMTVTARADPNNSTTSRNKRAAAAAVSTGMKAIYALTILLTGADLGFNAYTHYKGGDHETSQLRAQLKLLQEEVSKEAKDTFNIAKDMIGVTNITRQKVSRIERLGADLQSQVSIFDHNLKTLSTAIKHFTKSDYLSTQIVLSLLEQIDYMRRADEVVERLRRKITDYKIARVQLDSGFLPSTIISYSHLNDILATIRHLLPPELTLAFQNQEISKYYDRPLVRYAVVDNQLIMKLDIPLIERGQREDLIILTPSFSPFPVHRTKLGEASKGQMLMQINGLAKDLWVFNQTHFKYVSHKKFFSCLPRGAVQSCTSFHPNPVSEVSPCVEAIVEGNVTFIWDVCKFQSVSDATTYRPIEVGDGLYVIISSPKILYYQICDNSSFPIETELGTSYVVQIETGCQLLVTGKLFGGPLINDGRNFSTSLIRGRQEGKHLDRTELSTYYFEELPEIRMLPKLNLEKLQRSEIEAEERKIIEQLKRVGRAAERVEQRVQTLDSFNIASGPVSVGLWLVFDELDRVIFDFLFMFVLYLLVRDLHPIARMVVLPSPVRCLEDLAWNTFSPTSLITIALSKKFILAIKFTLYILLIIFYIYRRRFMRHFMSTHNAVSSNIVNRRFWFEISLTLKQNTLFSLRSKKITIYIPLTSEFRREVAYVTALKSSLTWYQKKGYILFNEPIGIRANYADGNYAEDCSTIEDLTIDWHSLHWDGVQAPLELFRDDGESGEALIRVIGDPSPLH